VNHRGQIQKQLALCLKVSVSQFIMTALLGIHSSRIPTKHNWIWRRKKLLYNIILRL